MLSCLMIMIGALTACSSINFGREYEVKFYPHVLAEEPRDVVTLQNGSELSNLEPPTREGHIFLGWYKDKAMKEKWNIDDDKVREDTDLYAAWDVDTEDEIVEVQTDPSFYEQMSPSAQESTFSYEYFFLPEVDGTQQPYVGDAMPYYEDGVFYIYYLKDGGDSYNHSIYLATTTDFINYEEYDNPIIESDRGGGQDSWIGTGSLVKTPEAYYFFYTGHTGSPAAEFKEKIMVAKGTDPFHLEKVQGWEIDPPAELGQKRDFRDPQAYYHEDTGLISLTTTAAQDQKARILKHSVSTDLQTVTYDGIIFTDETGQFWNLECSDTFRIGNTWYLTYSGQDDTLWYATATEQFGPYSEPKRIDGKLFYAAKHVENAEQSYMVGWARRSESPSSTREVSAWGGNLVVHEIHQDEDGALRLEPIQTLARPPVRAPLLIDDTYIYLEAGALYNYQEVFTAYDKHVITGQFRFTGTGAFGLSFNYDGQTGENKLISISPSDNSLQLLFKEGSELITETEIEIKPQEEYEFTYIQEGSVGVFYINDMASLTVRLYGVVGRPISLFAENNSVLFSGLRQYIDE